MAAFRIFETVSGETISDFDYAVYRLEIPHKNGLIRGTLSSLGKFSFQHIERTIEHEGEVWINIRVFIELKQLMLVLEDLRC